MKTRFSSIAAMTLLLTATSLAAPEAAPGARANGSASVARFIDAQTIGVARVDMSRIEPKAVEAWLADVAKGGALGPEGEAFVKHVGQGRGAAEKWLGDFRKAGGREIYVVMSLADLPGPPVLVIPLADGADANALEGLLAAGDAAAQAEARKALHFDRVWNVLLAATSRSSLERFRAIKPVERPDLMKALGAGGDAPVAAAVATSPDSRRAIEELLPTLPREVGGGSSTVITRGALWANLALTPPPQASLKLVVQSQDPEAAKALGALLDGTLTLLAKMAAAEKVPGMDAVLAALKPKPEGDRLVLTLDDPAFRQLAAGLIKGPVRQMRTDAKWVVSASNQRQLLMAALLWAEEKKGEWPDDIAKAAQHVQAPPAALSNPLKPGTGYTYLKPPAAPQNSAAIVVLYDAEPTDGMRNVGFMDGHVERLTEEAFQQQLKRTKEQAGKK